VDQTVNITCTASDNLSGVASSSCANIVSDAYTFALGSTHTPPARRTMQATPAGR
jgi:hypothetical protein